MKRDHVAVPVEPDHPYRSTCETCGGKVIRRVGRWKGAEWRHHAGGRQPLVPGPHPEARCQRCKGPNVRRWHAPSPLWNAVMRDPETGVDAYEIVCPLCFAELAKLRGFDYSWHFGPHEDVTPLWQDRDGRRWDAERCLWVLG